MIRHYSTTSFFRQMPNALLARHFEGNGSAADLDFAGMSETKPDTLLAAWLALPNEQRCTMDADFRVTALSSLPDHYERAMVTFLDYAWSWS